MVHDLAYQPLPEPLRARLLRLTHGASVHALARLFRPLSANAVARAACGMQVERSTRDHLARLVAAIEREVRP